jgi:hypothetical protein
MIDQMKDIIKHTHGLGFIEMVKVIGTDKEAKVEAIDADKTVVVYGDMYQPIKDIEITVGMPRLAQLKGFIELHEKSAMSVTNEVRANVSVPTELKFQNGKEIAVYRFMSETMANDQIKVPPFKGAVWNVTVTPSQANIDRLSKYSSILGAFEKRFIVSTDADGALMFAIGTGPTDRSEVPFADKVTGTLKHQWSWPLTQVLSILKLSGNEDVTMHFSDMGALKIEVDSGIGKYSYILPAGKA